MLLNIAPLIMINIYACYEDDLRGFRIYTGVVYCLLSVLFLITGKNLLDTLYKTFYAFY